MPAVDTPLSQLSEELNLLHDRICRAIGDPKRLVILYALAERPRYVVELAEQLGYPQPTVSRHLNALHSGGLVAKERQGQSVYYCLADPRIIDALDILRSILRSMTEASARVATAAGELGSVSEGEAGAVSDPQE